MIPGINPQRGTIGLGDSQSCLPLRSTILSALKTGNMAGDIENKSVSNKMNRDVFFIVRSISGGGNLQEDHTVHRHFGSIGSIEDSQIFLPPKVAQDLFSRKSRLLPIQGNLSRGLARVEKPNRLVPVNEFLDVDLQSTLRGNTDRRFAEFVLIDGQHLVIGDQAECEGVEMFKITSE